MATPRVLAPLQLDDPTPYRIADRDRLQHLLVRLARHPELVCLYPANDLATFALSALLHVGSDHLIFDAIPDERIEKKLQSSPQLICVSSLDRIHVQFNVVAPLSCRHEGRPALRTGWPLELLFVQRRDCYRLSAPVREPPICHIPQADGDEIAIPVADISLGGLGLTGPLPGIDAQPGLRLAACRLELPGVGIIPAELLVCATHLPNPRGEAHAQRIGCRFVQLSGRGQTLVLRYINQLERRRILHE